MNGEFFEALALLEREKGIPVDYLIEKISNAISIAIKRDMGGIDNNVVDINPAEKKFYVAVRKEVVDTIEDPSTEITLSDAVRYKKTAMVGDTVDIPLETKQFGRIAAQTAKHVIRQGISEAERGQLLKKFESKKCEIISSPVIKIDEEKGNITIEIDGSEVILPKGEQIRDEVIKEGQRIMVYVVDVLSGTRGPKLMVSRTHQGFVRRLFEMQTPEISEGIIEIKSVSREAGSRTKIAVSTNDSNVDPIGACIGPRGSRVYAIVNELNGEKIDVVKYSDDPKEFIAAALSPSQVVEVIIIDEAERRCRVIVPDLQLSLAIGNKGQNARLAARLTGWKIDIRPESQIEDIDDAETQEDTKPVELLEPTEAVAEVEAVEEVEVSDDVAE